MTSAPVPFDADAGPAASPPASASAVVVPVLPVADLIRSAAWYERLGFSVRGVWNDYVILDFEGAEVFDDAITFFQAFDGMEAGFKDRAKHVLDLITSPATSFVLVASPKRDTVDEARFFAEKLAEASLPVSALIVNRMHPHFTDALPE
ncbi:MAG: oxyanion-translocating ATPase, partial [Acidimicrobiales bacterium]|nr:oxyanion-translocating ATPase [Acidimicrobiales bacterium]